MGFRAGVRGRRGVRTYPLSRPSWGDSARPGVVELWGIGFSGILCFRWCVEELFGSEVSHRASTRASATGRASVSSWSGSPLWCLRSCGISRRWWYCPPTQVGRGQSSECTRSGNVVGAGRGLRGAEDETGLYGMWDQDQMYFGQVWGGESIEPRRLRLGVFRRVGTWRRLMHP